MAYKGYWNKRNQEQLVIDKLNSNPWFFDGMPGQDKMGLQQSMNSIMSDIEKLATEEDNKWVITGGGKGRSREQSWRRMFRNIVKLENHENGKGALAEGFIEYLGNGQIVPGPKHPARKFYDAYNCLTQGRVHSRAHAVTLRRILSSSTYLLMEWFKDEDFRIEKARKAAVPPPKKAEPPPITDSNERFRAEWIADNFSRMAAPARARMLYDLAKMNAAGAEGE
jgi:hypothetical protein